MCFFVIKFVAKSTSIVSHSYLPFFFLLQHKRALEAKIMLNGTNNNSDYNDGDENTRWGF